MWDTVRSFILEMRYQRLISHFRMFRFYWLNFMCCQGSDFLPSILFKSSLSFTRGHNQCYSICFIKRHFFIRFHYCDSDASYIHFIMLPNYLMDIIESDHQSYFPWVKSLLTVTSCQLKVKVNCQYQSEVRFILVFAKGPIFSFHGYVVTRSC